MALELILRCPCPSCAFMSSYSTIGGGTGNHITGFSATIAGGEGNSVTSTAFFGAIGGGSSNTATGLYVFVEERTTQHSTRLQTDASSRATICKLLQMPHLSFSVDVDFHATVIGAGIPQSAGVDRTKCWVNFQQLAVATPISLARRGPK